MVTDLELTEEVPGEEKEEGEDEKNEMYRGLRSVTLSYFVGRTCSVPGVELCGSMRA